MNTNSSHSSKGQSSPSKVPKRLKKATSLLKKGLLRRPKRTLHTALTQPILSTSIQTPFTSHPPSPLLTQLRFFAAVRPPTSSSSSRQQRTPEEIKAKIRPEQVGYKSNFRFDPSTATTTPNKLSLSDSTSPHQRKVNSSSQSPAPTSMPTTKTKTQSSTLQPQPHVPSSSSTPTVQSPNQTTPSGFPRVPKSTGKKTLAALPAASLEAKALKLTKKNSSKSSITLSTSKSTAEQPTVDEDENEDENEHDDVENETNPYELYTTIQHFQQRIAIGQAVPREEIENFLDLCLQVDCPEAVIEAWNIFDPETYCPKNNKELFSDAMKSFGLQKSQLKTPQIPKLNLNIYHTTIFSCALLGSATLAYQIYSMMGVDAQVVEDPYDDASVTRMLNLTLSQDLLQINEHNNVVFSLYTDLCYDISNHLGVPVNEVHDNFNSVEKDSFAYVKMLDCLTNPDRRYSHRLTQECVKNPYATHPAFQSEEFQRKRHSLPPRPERFNSVRNHNNILLDPNGDPLFFISTPAISSFSTTLVLLACLRSAQNFNEREKEKKLQQQRDIPHTRKYQSRKNELQLDNVMNSLNEPADDLFGDLPQDTESQIDSTIRAVVHRVLFHDEIKISPSHISLALFSLYSLSMRSMPSIFKIFSACAYRQLPLVPQTLFALMHVAKEANSKFHLFTYFDLHFISPHQVTFNHLSDALSNVQNTRRLIIEQGKNVMYTQKNQHALDWFESLDPFSKQMYHSDGGSYGLASRFGHLLFPNFLHVVSTINNIDNKKRSSAQIWGSLLEGGNDSFSLAPETYVEQEALVTTQVQPSFDSGDLVRPHHQPTVLNEYASYDEVEPILSPKDTNFAISIQRPIFYSFIMVLSAMRGLPYQLWSRERDAAPTLWRESLLLSEILSKFTAEPDRYVFSLSIESAMNANQAEPVLFLSERLLNRQGRVRVRLLDSLLSSLQPHHLSYSPYQQRLLTEQYHLQQQQYQKQQQQQQQHQNQQTNVLYSNSDSPFLHSHHASLQSNQVDVFQSTLQHNQHTTAQNQIDNILHNQISTFFNITTTNDLPTPHDLPLPHTPPHSQFVQLPIADAGLSIVSRLIQKAFQEPVEYATHQKRLALGLSTKFYDSRSFVSSNTDLEQLKSRIVEFESEDEHEFELLKYLRQQLLLREDAVKDASRTNYQQHSTQNYMQELVGAGLDEIMPPQIKLFNARALSPQSVISLVRSISGSGNALLSLSILSQILNIQSPVSQLYSTKTLPSHLHHLIPPPTQLGGSYNPNQILASFTPSTQSHTPFYSDSFIPTSLHSIFNSVQKLPHFTQFLEEIKYSYLYTLDFETLSPHQLTYRPITQTDHNNFLTTSCYHPHTRKMSSRDMSTLASQTLLSVALSHITHNTPQDLPLDSNSTSDLLYKLAQEHFSGTTSSNIVFGNPQHRKVTRLALANLLTWVSSQVGQKPTTLNYIGHLAALINISQITNQPNLVKSLALHTNGGTLDQRLEWAGIRDKKMTLNQQISTTLKQTSVDGFNDNPSGIIPDHDNDTEQESTKKKPSRRRHKVPFSLTLVHDMRKLEGKISSRTSYRSPIMLQPERVLGLGEFSDQNHRGQLHHVYLLAIEAMIKAGVVMDFPDLCDSILPTSPHDITNSSDVKTRNFSRDSYLYGELMKGETGAASLQLYNLAKKRFNWRDLTTSLSHLTTIDSAGAPKYELQAFQSIDQWLETLPWLPSAYTANGYTQSTDDERWTTPTNSIHVDQDVINSFQVSQRASLATQLTQTPLEMTSYNELFILNKVRDDNLLLDFRQMSIVHTSVAFSHSIHQLLTLSTTLLKTPKIPSLLLLLPTDANRDHVFPDTPLISSCCTSEFVNQTDHFSSLFPQGTISMDKIHSSSQHNLDIWEVKVSPLQQ